MDADRESIPLLKNASYLYARDPSILAWGIVGAGAGCRKNLMPDLGEVTTASSIEPGVIKKTLLFFVALIIGLYFRVIRYRHILELKHRKPMMIYTRFWTRKLYNVRSQKGHMLHVI